ncbi:HAMP domain-containing histidine kinase [Vagococcus sp. PNs007]|uniref:histidine kinase n=1 Tax=Vagococcus proximus TaxID=2991417 RepID=A0ABT5X121_9ENTE|nr:HAMP domain-containing sensor histidine kinase [Vagococcus proximus]MDF0479701.1 HAMP domain-containing histidine kinase [Vagococcus proximus]
MKNRGLALTLAVILVAITSIWFKTMGAVISNKNSQFDQLTVERELSDVYVYNYLESYDKNKIESSDISEAEIEEYRYRFGNLGTQVVDITEQYRSSIAQAKRDKSPQKEAALIEERDQKISAVVDNYRDEGKVRKKIVKEYNQEIIDNKDKIVRDYTPLIKTIKEKYWYYLVDAEGNVYKNKEFSKVNMSEENIYEYLKKETVAKPIEIDMAIEAPQVLTYTWRASASGHSLRGVVAIAKGSELEKDYLREAQKIKNQRMSFSGSLVLLIIGAIIGYFYLKSPNRSRLVTMCNKIPLDSRVFVLIFTLGLFVFVTRLGTLRYFPVGILILIIMFSLLLSIAIIFLVKSSYLSLEKLSRNHQVKAFLKETWPVKIVGLCMEMIRKLPIFLQVLGAVCIVVGISFNMATVFLQFYSDTQISWLITLAIGGSLLVIFTLLMWRREVRIDQLKGELNKVLAAYSDNVDQSHTTADMLLDMDELKAVISQVTANSRQSEALKTELLTNVSHDLRTPLTSIISYGDLLTKDNLTEKERLEYTEIINRNADRMKKLINDLFDVTKLNNGEIRLSKQTVNMGQLLEQSVAEYEEELEKKELKLIVTKPSEPILVSVDGDKMWRVIDNLMGNIIKYSLPHTRVYLRLEELPDRVSIQLKNISKYELNENAQQLVERFTRGDSARQTEGSGLGLAIVNAIVLLHGGKLDIVVDGDMFKITILLPKD